MPMKPTINELVNNALTDWATVTDFDGTQTRFTLHFDRDWSDYDVHRATEDMNESRDLDPTGLTTFMMLRGNLESYLKGQTFSAYDLLINSESVEARLAQLRHLRQSLEHPLVVGTIDAFQNTIRNTATVLGFNDQEGLETLLTDRYRLGFIRRDALVSMERFNAYQFMQGTGQDEPFQFNRFVYEMWNVNSLLRAMRDQFTPGVSCVLIRDPEVCHSFFVLAIKNGDTITILTDKEEDCNPAYRHTTRNPGRGLERREAQHWFPYQLLDLKVSSSNRLYADARSALVPINAEAVKIANVADLTPYQFVWMILVTELVYDRFGRNNVHLPALSYTGEMVRTPNALVSASNALVQTGQYQLLSLPVIKAENLTGESTAGLWEDETSAHYQWMVDRYGDRVPDSMYEVIGETQQKQLGQETGLMHFNYNDYKKHSSLEMLDPQSFGTAEKLQRDRTWIARHNQMLYIQKLAEEEFRQERENMCQWYENAVRENEDELIDAAIAGVFNATCYYPPDFGNGYYVDGKHFEGIPPLYSERNILKTYSYKLKYPFSQNYHQSYSRLNGDVRFGQKNESGYWTCAIDRTSRASIYATLKPDCGQALAQIVGCDLDELPWALRHWNQRKPYTGNAGLSFTDSIDWVLENPWRECDHAPSMSWAITFAFSRRAWSARRKILALDPTTYPAEKKGR